MVLLLADGPSHRLPESLAAPALCCGPRVPNCPCPVLRAPEYCMAPALCCGPQSTVRPLAMCCGHQSTVRPLPCAAGPRVLYGPCPVLRAPRLNPVTLPAGPLLGEVIE
ncbi:unnamed protein product [Arctogadus glacialis]